MKPILIKLSLWSLIACLAAGFWGCIRHDEPEPGETVTVKAVISQSGYVDEELDFKLGSEKDLPIRKALMDYIRPIFYSDVRDIDISLFDQRQHGTRTAHLTDFVNGLERVFSLEDVVSDYRYGAAANLSPNPSISLSGGETEQEYSLVQASGTVDSHRAALFSTRGRFNVRKEQGAQVTATLCMNNAVAALVLNRDSCEVKGIRATYEGMADSFRVLDSIYSYDRQVLINTDPIDIQPYLGSDQDLSSEADFWSYDLSWTQWTKTPLMVCGAGFPTRNLGSDVIDGKVIVWTIHLYVTMADGTITKNDIFIGQPVMAGRLKVIKGWLLGDGSFSPTPPLDPQGGIARPDPDPGPPTPPSPDDTVVGVNVYLDWKEGISYDPVL